ncbi:MAG: hypothetical protein KQH63_07870 [Desulfobulbaceae bacterium]|nr:hypothetical protein [Desulfobulbaceae bacterium]
MLDIFIGKPPTQNHPNTDPSPILRKVRELLRIARNSKRDRRKNTGDRRRRENRAVIVNLSHQQEKRTRLDRRQNPEFRGVADHFQERRKKLLDRRRSVNEGVHVTLSTKDDRRSGRDRRGNRIVGR